MLLINSFFFYKMTTVICDGKFMIADCNTSGNYKVKRVVNGHTKTLQYQTNTNDGVKIHTPKHLTYKGVKVVAVGLAGNLGTINSVVSCFFNNTVRTSYDGEKFELQDTTVEQICEFIKSFSTCIRHGFSCLGLLESGKMFEIKYTAPVFILGNSEDNKGTLKITNIKDGEVAAIGSGGGRWQADEHMFEPRPHILDIFLLVAQNDVHSSTKYSVFSLEEKELITELTPPPEEVRQRLIALQSTVSLCKGPKKNTHLVKI